MKFSIDINEEVLTELGEEFADHLLADKTFSMMKEKLMVKRAQGRGGWYGSDVSFDSLWSMLDEHMKEARTNSDQIIDCINLLAMIRFKIELTMEQ